MDNAYQQKLQERATTLAREYYKGIFDFFEDPRKQEAILEFKKISALTLGWSANNVIDCMKAAECSAFDPEVCKEYLISQGFIPHKTDNNE